MISRAFYLSRIRSRYRSKTVKVISGVRRCGKTVFLEQIREDLLARGADPHSVVLFSLEKKEGRRIRTRAAFEALLLARLGDMTEGALLLDGADRVEGWEEVLSALAKSRNLDIFATCSGFPSKLPASGFEVFPLYPFSFSEFCELHAERDREACWNWYLRIGGIPLASAAREEREALLFLEDCCRSIAYQDIVERRKVRDAGILTAVVHRLAADVGRIVTANWLARSLRAEGRQVSVGTAAAYLRICVESGIVCRISRIDLPGGRVLSSGEKYFFVDHGFWRAVDSLGGGGDLERALEGIICVELLRRGYAIYAARTAAGEVSFACERNGSRFYVQVAGFLAAPEMLEQKLSVLRSIRDNYPKIIVSMDRVNFSQGGIIHQNIVDFLLTPSSEPLVRTSLGGGGG